MTLDPAAPQMTLYVDSGLRGTRALDFLLSALTDVNNWIGRSNYSQDSGFDGSVEDLRIYGRALGAEEILGSFLRGPDAP